MAYALPNVRSHRRGGRRRRRGRKWLRVTVVAALLVGGLGLGYMQLLAHTCSGQATARLVASPSTATLLGEFAADWATGEPSTEDGTCAQVIVESRESADVAAALADGWDDADGEPPDVWVPESTAWAQKAAASNQAEPWIPDLRPSIARTPTVIAMPEPMAAEFEWPETRLQQGAEVRWESFVEEFAGEETADDSQGWARFGHPEWGEFRFGMTDPARDTAGLLALTAILDADENGETSNQELGDAVRLHRLLAADAYHETTEELLAALAAADAEGAEAALRYVSAFPALEQEVLSYNRTNPEVRLAAVYPTNGNIEADHPYLVLNADWLDGRTREVAGLFLDHVRSADPQAALREAGFRGTRNREPGDAIAPQNGLVPQLVALPRAVLVPESVNLTIDQWTALTRPSNVLIAVDVSGSMEELVPGTSDIRLERAADAAAEVVRLFTDDDRVGLWEFSTALDGERDYRTMVALGPLGDLLEDGRTRRDHLLDAAGALQPQADTGLYNTVQAAYDAVLAGYDPEATNLVVVITDGKNETADRPTISLPELSAHLESTPDDQRVRVVTVSFGGESDYQTMRQISELTGGQAYFSRDGFDLVDLLRTAVFSGAQQG